MTPYDQKKLIQIVLYVLNQTGGVDYYHLFKILYFAERKNLAKWGHRIISDDFYALEYGPVPTCLYDAVKGSNAYGTTLADQLREVTMFAGSDAPNVLLAKCDADLSYISKSEKAELDKSIKDNLLLSFSQLKAKSHDSAWAVAHKKSCKRITPMDMARVEKANYATIEYIAEQETLRNSIVGTDDSDIPLFDEFAFTPVTKEELAKRRVPSYSYLM